MAIQYAVAMGLQVIAIDTGKVKLEHCREQGAQYVVDADEPQLVDVVRDITSGGAHGVLCVAPASVAFETGVKITRSKGTMCAIGLPKDSFPCEPVDIVMRCITIKGSLVGTRNDLQEALGFVARGQVTCPIQIENFEHINEVIQKLRAGKYEGRAVMVFE